MHNVLGATYLGDELKVESDKKWEQNNQLWLPTEIMYCFLRRSRSRKDVILDE